MKKFIVVAAVALSLYSAQAVTVSQTVRGGEMTNLVATAGGRITQFALTSAANNSGYVWFIDAPDKNYRYTNAVSYTYTKYATNDIVSWVNFFGATNWTTNVVLKLTTNTVAAATNNMYPIILTSIIGTNVSQLYDGTYDFYRGLTVTNAGSGAISISVTYSDR